MTVRILHGDCRQVLRTLPDDSVHCDDGRFVKGQRRSPATEFKPGQHWRPQKPHWDRAWLENQLVTLARPACDIAAEVGVTESAIDYWALKHKIKRRTTSEVRASKRWGVSGPGNPMFGRRGADCPAYIDGSSPIRGTLFSRADGRAFRAAVLERDGYVCRRCGWHGTPGPDLPVHHIKPWAGNPTLRYEPSNGVTLCKPCHLWVHSKKNVDREWLA